MSQIKTMNDITCNRISNQVAFVVKKKKLRMFFENLRDYHTFYLYKSIQIFLERPPHMNLNEVINVISMRAHVMKAIQVFLHSTRPTTYPN